MRVAVVGGRLQGVEACYLAGKAGWEVVLIDKRATTPAAKLCHAFYKMDVIKDSEIESLLEQVDLIIPALENDKVLARLKMVAKSLNKPILYDSEAYSVSSSKHISNNLFAEWDIPRPNPWPSCEYPLIIKPLGASGSEGVQRINNAKEFKQIENLLARGEFIVEEYLEGPSYSIEVIGVGGSYKVFQITELEMDQVYDCKRVVAPAKLSLELSKELEEIALKLAKILNLNGLMDVEVILNKGKLKVLEIDARLPSQTPTAVFKSSGLNMVQVLGEALVFGTSLDKKPTQEKRPKSVIYEHIKVSAEAIEVLGEHMMGQYGPLSLSENFYGADEALIGYSQDNSEWVATLICTGSNEAEVWAKRNAVLEHIYTETIKRGCKVV